MTAPQDMETTIWSKLEAEKKRRNEIRTRISMEDGSGSRHGRAHPLDLGIAPSPPQPVATSPPQPPPSPPLQNPARSPSEPQRISDQPKDIFDSAPNTPKQATQTHTIATAPSSAPTGTTQREGRNKVKSVKTSHNRMPNFQTGHFHHDRPQKTPRHHNHHHSSHDENIHNMQTPKREIRPLNPASSAPSRPERVKPSPTDPKAEPGLVRQTMTPPPPSTNMGVKRNNSGSQGHSSKDSRSSSGSGLPQAPDLSRDHHPHATTYFDEDGGGFPKRTTSMPTAANMVDTSHNNATNTSIPRPTSLNSAATQETRATSVATSATNSPVAGGARRQQQQQQLSGGGAGQHDNGATIATEKPPLRRRLRSPEEPRRSGGSELSTSASHATSAAAAAAAGLMDNQGARSPPTASVSPTTSVGEPHSPPQVRNHSIAGSSNPSSELTLNDRSNHDGSSQDAAGAGGANSLDAENQSQHSHSSRRSTSGPIYGSTRFIQKDKVIKTEKWVYIVAMFLFLVTTGGLSCILLFVFGARGTQITDSERIQASLEYLSNQDSTVHVFDDPTTPQSLALNWLLNEDEGNVDLLSSQSRREVRYALAVLYFSANRGEVDWKDNLRFLSKYHECYWHDEDGLGQGVACNEDMRLVNITIVDQGLRGSLPIELSALSDLQVLDVHSNSLTGSIPSIAFQELEILNVSDNQLDGTIPYSLTAMTTLTTIDISKNRLSSTLPMNLSSLEHLEWFHCTSNQLTGEFPDNSESMLALKDLDVSHNQLSGPLEFVQNMPFLESLEVSSNQFSGTLPFILGGLTELVKISFGDNQMEGTLPTTLGLLTDLTYLNGSENMLSGSFPWEYFAGDSPMIELYMGNNLLSGSITATDLLRMTDLEVVHFGRNLLTGSVPDRIGSMGQLRVLNLSSNRFSEDIPSILGFLDTLVEVDLSGNELTGTIPASFGNLMNLEKLNLQSNGLFGTVPDDLCNLSTLGRVRLQNNYLSGDIDCLCSTVSPVPIISADCAGDAPELTCSCCDICLERESSAGRN